MKETDGSGDAIADCRVTLKNVAEATLDSKITDVNGQVIWALDNGTYYIYLSKLGSYTFTIPETLVVSGNTSDEYYGTPFSPGSPSSLTLCRVYGWILDSQGQALESVTILAKMIGSGIWADGGQQVDENEVSTTTDASGYWELDMIRAVELMQENQYNIVIDQINYEQAITVPDLANASLDSIVHPVL